MNADFGDHECLECTLIKPADYSYVVKVNRKPISCGRLFGHDRERRWKALVEQVLEDSQATEVGEGPASL
jgi:hypothetical protein